MDSETAQRGGALDVFSGEVTTVSYTVTSNLGAAVTKSFAPNRSSGWDTFTLPDAGITSVTIGRRTPRRSWDLFIDNVRFTAFPAATECKNGGCEAFDVFKNQADCVSWLATGGKNGRAG